MGYEVETRNVHGQGDFAGAPAVSTGVEYDVEVSGDADEERLRALVARVDAIAEIPGSLRRGTPVRLAAQVTRRTSPG